MDIDNLEQPVLQNTPMLAWGSDVIATVLRDIGIPFISLTPGASYRGLHDSLVNFLGNKQPRLLLCIHEEHAVAMAHGYAKVTGKPMAVALHSNVGLMHATMAIFNAWCDRVPMLLIGAQGPMDAPRRRPWVDWIHTARDLGSMIRGYIKWDDQPASVEASVEALTRAHLIAQTAPPGPTYVCLDAGFQEQALTAAVEMPQFARHQVAPPQAPSPEAVARAVDFLSSAKRLVMLLGRTTRDQEAWNSRIRLAETLNALVISDLRTGASFPTRHPLHPHAPGLYLTEGAIESIGQADVILSLDWVDLAGTLRQAGKGRPPAATVIHCSVDQYSHNGWSMDHLGLPPVDLMLLSTPEMAVSSILAAIKSPPAKPAYYAQAQGEPKISSSTAGASSGMDIATFARCISRGLSSHSPCYIRLPIGWPGEFCDFRGPLDYLGYDGGGGIGSGPGMAVGAALALSGTRHLPVAVIGDGDYLMGLTALWTAAHYRIGLLVIVANNASFFNDEVHQERVARTRNRPVENRWIGLRISDPDCDLAGLARGQGVEGLGPFTTEAELTAAVEATATRVRAGATCVIDARVVPGYDRSVVQGTNRS